MSDLYRDFIDQKADQIINSLGGTITPAPANAELYRDFLERKFDDVINALPSSPSSGHHYSTDEQVIGTWIDGKPLYEKTINFGTLPNNNTKEVNHGISDIDHIWIFAGWAEKSSNGYTNLLSLANETLSGQWYFGVNKTVVQCWAGSDRRNYSNCYVVVHYTKSTDTAGY